MDTLVGGAIMVDRSGRRFLNEGLGGIALSNALARLPDPLAATAVFDQAIWDGAGRTELVPPNPQLEAAGGTLVRADDLAALAAAIEVPADNLQDTVAGYNRAVLARRRQHALVPTRTTSGRMFGESRGSSKRVELMPIAQPPFYAIASRSWPASPYTMGGIEIDLARPRHRPRRRPLSGLLRGRLLHRWHRGRSARRLCAWGLPQGRHAWADRGPETIGARGCGRRTP